MKRLDVAAAERGLASSREKAKRLIADGKITVNGAVVTKPAFAVSDSDELAALESEKYVGRGAYKLIGAFEAFPIDVRGKICADIGASTGGFTQVLLENGAQLVYAVDIGHGQLAQSLAQDSRVRNIEGVNARYMQPEIFDSLPQFMCCDLSFISLTQVLTQMAASLTDGGEIVALIKPQFEAGKAALNKNGLVRGKKDHIRTLDTLCAFFAQMGLSLRGLTNSPICGGDGNIEYLAHLEKSDVPSKSFDIKKIVDIAFENADQW